MKYAFPASITITTTLLKLFRKINHSCLWRLYILKAQSYLPLGGSSWFVTEQVQVVSFKLPLLIRLQHFKTNNVAVLLKSAPTGSMQGASDKVKMHFVLALVDPEIKGGKKGPWFQCS